MTEARRFFGDGQSVSPLGVKIPKGEIFIAVPDPIPADYDGYQAVLVPVGGSPLTDAAAVRFVFDGGVRDAELLARVAAVFLGDSRQVAHERDREHDYIRGHDVLKDPVLADGRLVFYEVRGNMVSEAYQVSVDLASFRATARPASEMATPVLAK